MEMLRLIGMLLDYPDEALWQHQQDVFALAQQQPALLTFAHRYFAAQVLDKQAEWCALFERGRAVSLLLFEHVHGESRDRGQAMVDLLAQYEQAGLWLNCRELPDYLPLYLEYLSTQPKAAAVQGLLDIAPILALIGGRLKERNSAFYVLFDVLLSVAGSPLRSDTMAQQVAGEVRDDTPAALDTVWEEEQVTFMGNTACQTGAAQQHQQRFRDAVSPQYLDLSAGATR